jgi:hypothetical protein
MSSIELPPVMSNFLMVRIPACFWFLGHDFLRCQFQLALFFNLLELRLGPGHLTVIPNGGTFITLCVLPTPIQADILHCTYFNVHGSLKLKVHVLLDIVQAS